MNVYKKWEEIMNHIIPNKSYKIKHIFCEYADHHSSIINENENISPLSIKVMSEVEDFDRIMEKNNFILSKTPIEKKVIKLKLSSYDSLDELQIGGVKYVEMHENKLKK